MTPRCAVSQVESGIAATRAKVVQMLRGRTTPARQDLGAAVRTAGSECSESNAAGSHVTSGAAAVQGEERFSLQLSSGRHSQVVLPTPAAATAVLWNVSRLFQRRSLDATQSARAACDVEKSAEASCGVSADAPMLTFHDLLLLMHECSASSIETQHI